uniref:Expression site-associated gene 12 (ESAG12) protein n=2 Tax=Trypanosoma brucei TaxID=5691 RepID=B3GVC7_TRYBB|nr:hypothetical protein Tb427.BES40.8 [Trypanosoma brucei brucei]
MFEEISNSKWQICMEMEQAPAVSIFRLLTALICASNIAVEAFNVEGGVKDLKEANTMVRHGIQLERISEDIAKCLKHDKEDPEGWEKACNLAEEALDMLKRIAGELNGPRGNVAEKPEAKQGHSEKITGGWRDWRRESIKPRIGLNGSSPTLMGTTEAYVSVMKVCVEGGGVTSICLVGSASGVKPDKKNLQFDFDACVQNWIDIIGECGDPTIMGMSTLPGGDATKGGRQKQKEENHTLQTPSS